MPSTSRCLCLNALHPASYRALLPPGVLAHALVTDPPFLLLTPRRARAASARPRKLHAPEVVRFADAAAYLAFSRAWLAAALPHVSRAGTLAIFTNALGRAPLVAACAEQGWALEGAIPWAKYAARAGAPPQRSSASEVLLRVYETALVLRTPATARAPTHLTRGSLALLSPYADEDVAGGGEGGPHPHPHAKPRGALLPLLAALTRPGDIVLDCFAGSGAIPAAAKAAGRVGLGMELRADWAAQAQARVLREREGAEAGAAAGHEAVQW
jgi:hypothetical protein